MGYTVVRPDEREVRPPSRRPEERARTLVELPLHARMRHSRTNVVEPGTPLKVRNESDREGVVSAYGSPADPSAGILE